METEPLTRRTQVDPAVFSVIAAEADASDPQRNRRVHERIVGAGLVAADHGASNSLRDTAIYAVRRLVSVHHVRPLLELGWQPGHCGAADLVRRGDCATGDHGAWRLHRGVWSTELKS